MSKIFKCCRNAPTENLTVITIYYGVKELRKIEREKEKEKKKRERERGRERESKEENENRPLLFYF